jgi:ABC-type nitrate/sulfonate/bicarbonate transport system substrate-binding protein
MKTKLSLCLLLFLVVGLFAGSVQSQQVAPRKIRLLTLLGRPLQVTIAETHGLFAKYGVAVETENSPNSDELRAKLAAGTGDIAYAAVDNAIALALSGTDVIIVGGGEGSQNELITQREIKLVKDLRGKILIVDAPNTAYALQLKKIMLLNGLRGGDYEIKPVGVTPMRLAAMREHHEYAGSMLGPPASILAKRAGLVSLGSVQDLIGPYQAAGSFTQRRWAHEHRDALVSYLAAFLEAQRWLMEPGHKSDVIELLIKDSHLPAEVAAETYILSMTRPGGFAADAELDVDGLVNVLRLRAEIEGSWGGQPPLPKTYYDSSYYDAARAKPKRTE